MTEPWLGQDPRRFRLNKVKHKPTLFRGQFADPIALAAWQRECDYGITEWIELLLLGSNGRDVAKSVDDKLAPSVTYAAGVAVEPPSFGTLVPLKFYMP